MSFFHDRIQISLISCKYYIRGRLECQPFQRLKWFFFWFSTISPLSVNLTQLNFDFRNLTQIRIFWNWIFICFFLRSLNVNMMSLKKTHDWELISYSFFMNSKISSNRTVTKFILHMINPFWKFFIIKEWFHLHINRAVNLKFNCDLVHNFFQLLSNQKTISKRRITPV